MLDGSGVKATPESIPTPNSVSLQKNTKIQVAKWGTPKKYLKKLMTSHFKEELYFIFIFWSDELSKKE
jgi:hypothetical protein